MPKKNCSGRWQPKASRGYRLKHQREIWAICMMFSDKSRISCALPQDLTRLQGVAPGWCKKCCKMQSGSRSVGGMPTIENGEWRSLLQYRRSLERPVVNCIDTCMNVAGMCRWSSLLGSCVAGSGVVPVGRSTASAPIVKRCLGHCPGEHSRHFPCVRAEWCRA